MSTSAQGDNIDELLMLSLEELMDIDVTIATGKSQRLSKAPAVISVITASDIAAMGITEFSQILELVPGVHVYPDTLARLDSHFSIRGIHSTDNAQVLVLVDGHDITYQATGSTPTSFRLPVAMISKVEVMRGPGSALYGADAFAGVINIITKKSSEIGGTQFGWRQGSFDTQESWLIHGGKLEGWDFTFSLETSRSEGDQRRVVQRDGAEGLGTSLAPGPLETRYDVMNTRVGLANERWKFTLWNWSLEDGGVGQGAAQILDPVGRDDLDLYEMDVEHNASEFLPGWGMTTRLTYQLMNSDAQFAIFPPGTTLPIGSDGNVTGDLSCIPTCLVTFSDGVLGNPGGTQRKSTLDLKADYSGFGEHQLLVGVGIEHIGLDTRETKNFGPGVIDGTVPAIDGTLTDVTGTENIFLERQSRTVQHLLLQDEWSFDPDWVLTAGLRYDNYSDFGNTTNPRLALVWAGRPQLTTKLLFGRAFRAPSFGDLYFKNNPSTLGNKDLRPERIGTVELVFDYRPTREVNTVLSLYSYQIKDLITRENGMSSINAGSQQGRGVEFEVKWHAGPMLQIQSAFALQHSKDSNTGQRVADAPLQQFYTNALWSFMPSWSLGTQWKWIGERKRAFGDTRSQIGSYSLLDLTLRRRQLLPNMELVLSVRNALNDDAFEPSPYNADLGVTFIPGDYPLAGRSYYGELNFRF